MNIRLVALDMDGTLLDSRKRLPSDFIPWVKAHPHIRTVIASGRQYATLKQEFEEIEDRLIFLAENGGLVFEHGEPIYTDSMADGDVRACLELVRNLPGVTPILCGVRAAHMPPAPDDVCREADRYYRSMDRSADFLLHARKDTIVKIALYAEDSRAEAVMPDMQKLGGGIAPVLSGCDWIDVANRGASKGAALRALQERLGISRPDCMAFGDYLNDYELLEACEESYCMENGHPALKAIAKHIADSNDDDGVMKVLRTLQAEAGGAV